MRVVVDTNIFISAPLKHGSFPNLALYRVSQRCVLLKSVVTEAQFFEVIVRPYLTPLIRPETRAWLTELMPSAELVTITERVAVCRDPTDDKFLELVINGRADMIVTGDLDLLVLGSFRGVPIVTPRGLHPRAGIKHLNLYLVARGRNVRRVVLVPDNALYGKSTWGCRF